MYAERPAAFAGGVVWHSTSDGAEFLILPDGCIDVIWLGGRLVIAGPDAVGRTVAGSDGRGTVGLRFAPGQAPAVLGVVADELVGRTLDLDDVVPSRLGLRLAHDCAEAEQAGSERVCEALETAFARSAADTDDPVRRAVVAMIDGGDPISEVAHRVGLSSRQLQRRSLRWFGYGPKHLAAVLRLQRAVERGRSGMSAGAVAASVGYADQSHLVRDARRLAGVPFGELIG